MMAAEPTRIEKLEEVLTRVRELKRNITDIRIERDQLEDSLLTTSANLYTQISDLEAQNVRITQGLAAEVTNQTSALNTRISVLQAQIVEKEDELNSLDTKIDELRNEALAVADGGRKSKKRKSKKRKSKKRKSRKRRSRSRK